MKTGQVVDGVWVVEYDSDAGTYTTRDARGKVLTSRQLTAEEVAVLAEMDADSKAVDVLRVAAAGTGSFTSAAGRDAAIRACARAILRRS